MAKQSGKAKRAEREARRAAADGAVDPTDGPCPLCDRPMPAGSWTEHHLVPKSQGGRQTVPLHHICHKTVHRLYDERTLARRLNTIEALRADPEIQGFLTWIAKRPPGFSGRVR